MFDIRRKFRNDENSFFDSKREIDSFEVSLQRLLKAKRSNAQLTEDYLPLAKVLPPMVTGTKGNLQFSNQSRLTLLKGKLPYLPCRIKLYSEKDVKNCFELRTQRGHTFWIVLFGDSKMRNKFFFLTLFTDKIFRWVLKDDMENKNMSLKELVAYKYNLPYVNREAVSASGARITYICSKFGLPNDKLLELFSAEEEGPVPDILLLEFGLWSVLTHPLLNFKAEDKSLSVWLTVKEKLKKFAKRTAVIAAVQTRLRNSPRTFLKFRKPSKLPKEHLRYFILDVPQSDFLDISMISAIGNSDFIIWDSTLPFNLASTRDCIKLFESNHSIIWQEFKVRKLFSRFMCHDDVHRTRATLQDETSILMNLMCNKYLIPNSNNELCCT